MCVSCKTQGSFSTDGSSVFIQFFYTAASSALVLVVVFLTVMGFDVTCLREVSVGYVRGVSNERLRVFITPSDH
jgi:hypothetical protein